MKKLIILLLLLVGCASNRILVSNSINSKITRGYVASVSITTEDGRVFGSGTIIRNKRAEYLAVITAAHVIRSMQKRNIDIYILTAYSVKTKLMHVSKINDGFDLALLIGNSKEVSDGPYVKVSNKFPSIGDSIWAIGAPLGDQLTVTRGIVSNFEKEKTKKLYRITAEIFYGNSGGGLFNEQNELIGVVHAMKYVQQGFSVLLVPGAGFAISLENIRMFL